ncbi:MAG: hypothetical protein WD904_10370 [Dehalococcoidia bacterium]
MAYFLIAVSNRYNLDLCLRYGLAGFTSSASGLWTFLDINEGDFVSFLYGARVFNLYQVDQKAAYRGADQLPPWPPVTFQPSGRTYVFPFRAQLRPIRVFNEPLVRSEFAYVGENLLLRGGYRKTHFQADQTTLQAASEMGELWAGQLDELNLGKVEIFTPLLTKDKSRVAPPESFLFRELFLQAMVRSRLSSGADMSSILARTGLAGYGPSQLEVLSEKAFPEGHVDLLVKESTPKGVSNKVVIEIKGGVAAKADVEQLVKYRSTLGAECVGAILIARAASSKVRNLAEDQGVIIFDYRLDFPSAPASFNDLSAVLKIV